MPSISVIVPVYQGESCIRACVESVLNQTFQDFELLLIDDGSRDRSPEICDEFAGKDSRVRVFHKPNGGVSSARNLGLQEAAGEFIAFLDSDDAFVPSTLETLWSMIQTSDADTAGCAHINLSPDGSRSTELLLPEGVYDPEGMRSKIIAPLLGERLNPPIFNGFIWRYLFSASILKEQKIVFEGAYLEDEIFLMEYFCHARALAVTETPLYIYLLNPNSATHRYMKDYMEVFSRFLERKIALANQYDLNALSPLWKENTIWAGLLIAIGNEYASDNPKSLMAKEQWIKALCKRPMIASAMERLKPRGMGRRKQMVADLILHRQFRLLSAMYYLKNRR